MRTPSLRGLGLCLSVLLAVIVVLVSTASAAPPPPDFWGFQIRNNSGLPVTEIKVKLFIPTTDQMPAEPAVEMEVEYLSHGRTFKISLPKTHGVARIQVSAKRDGRTANVCITAVKGNYDGQPGDEWPGFTNRILCNPAMTSPLEVEFRGIEGQYPCGSARLRGRPYWDGTKWTGPEIVDQKPFVQR